jgi:hypothetical protein
VKRDDLLAAMENIAAEKPRLVTVKGLGDVHIRELTIGEIDAQIADNEAGTKWTAARGACRLLCDENGVPLLDPNNKDDVARMAKLPTRVLAELSKQADKVTDSGN